MGKLKQMPARLGGLPMRVGFAPKVADSIYLTPEWRALVVDIKRERGNRCEDCGSTNRVVGDHVHEIKDGGAVLDKRNVRLRCWPCHGRKTADARKARAQGEVYGTGRADP